MSSIIPKKSCACCGFSTIFEIKQTCPVCYWEEDSYQESQLDDNGGPNTISLREAKENFKQIGASHHDYSSFVRDPLENEKFTE
jgi:hypothetical protein